MHSSALVAAALTALFTTVSGHMFMKTPAPFKVGNNPLDPSGKDFPCKLTYTGATGANTIPVGTPQILSFTGGATHGGGSCQIALTTDKQPTAQSKWSVIHSIIGGCPTNTTDGNLSDTDAEFVDPSTFGYTVPSDFAPGDYIMGVTWFNKIGNREMYMFCAPVSLTGGSSKRGIEVRKTASRGTSSWFNRRANYPDLFRANIGQVGAGCATTESTDLAFPDPGDSIEYDRPGGANAAKGPVACASPTVAPGAGGSGNPSGVSAGSVPARSSAPGSAASGAVPTSAAVQASSAPALTSAVASEAPTSAAAASMPATATDECLAGGSQPAATSAAAASPTVVTAGGGSAAGVSVAPVPTSSAASSAAPVVASTAAAAPPATSAAAAAPSSGSTGSTTGSGTTGGGLTGACTNEGAWNCIGGTSFQRCASGQWSAVQAMAGGTSCKAGVSDALAQ